MLSLLLQDCHVHAIARDYGALTAQNRQSMLEDTGFSFVNCRVTGSGALYLGRAWGTFSRVVFAYTYMDNIIIPNGWYNWGDPNRELYVPPHPRLSLSFHPLLARSPQKHLTHAIAWLRHCHPQACTTTVVLEGHAMRATTTRPFEFCQSHVTDSMPFFCFCGMESKRRAQLVSYYLRCTYIDELAAVDCRFVVIDKRRAQRRRKGALTGSIPFPVPANHPFARVAGRPPHLVVIVEAFQIRFPLPRRHGRTAKSTVLS